MSTSAALWDLLLRSIRACRGSRALAAILISIAVVIWAFSPGAVRLLYDEKVPILSDRLFRSRDLFDVDFYLRLTANYRYGLAGGLFGAGTVLLLGKRVWIVAMRISTSLEKRHDFRIAALASCAIVLFIVVWVWGPPIFETNDDAILSALLSGAWTGVPDPRIGFVGKWLAQALVALAAAAPSVPWWGVTLVAGQTVAVLLLLYIVIRAARANATQPLWWMALGCVLSFGAYSVLFLQFTQVSISLGGAGLLLVADSVRLRRWALVRRAVLFVPLVLIAAGVRAPGVMLAVALITTAYLFPHLALSSRRPDVPIRVTLRHSIAAVALTWGVAVFAFGVSSPISTANVSQQIGEWSAPLVPEQACFSEAQNTSWVKFARQEAGALSDNDVRLIALWVRPTSALFRTHGLESAAAQPGTQIPWECTLKSPELPPLMALLGFGMLILVLIPNGMPWASRSIAAIAVSGSVSGLLLIDSLSRAPLRVVFPAMAIIAVGLLLAFATSTPPQTRTKAPSQIGAVALLMFLLPIIIGVVLIIERLHLAHDDGLGQVEFHNVLAELPSTSDHKPVLVWFEPIESSHALELPITLEEGRPLPVAGWHLSLPSLDAAHERTGTKDWVKAVTDGEVVLIASRDLVDIVMKFLEERRAFGCPTPELVAESELVAVSGASDTCKEFANGVD